MTKEKYLKMLVEDIHSSVMATIGSDGHPRTRVIDLMLWDKEGIYFLTAKGKEFYQQLMEQKYIALSATKGKISVSLHGKIRNIGNNKLDEIFEKNTYMQGIYPGNTRTALEVFQIYEANGEYFDISVPEHIVRESFKIGDATEEKGGYIVGEGCIGCGKCCMVCPQECIDIVENVAVIEQNRCLHCGRCVEACPEKVIGKR